MLAKTGELPSAEDEGWAYEIKWDGMRALGFADGGAWRMQSRRLEDDHRSLPGAGADRREPRRTARAVLDGEVVALRRGRAPELPAASSGGWA